MDLIAEILMGCCSVTVLFAYLPQIIRLIKRKKSGDISIFSWSVWLFESTCYVIYSVHSRDPVFIITESISFISAIIILTLTIKYRKNNKDKDDKEDVIQDNKHE